MEKEKEPFQKYDITVLPTMVVMTPEGREIGRFGDFYPPKEFIVLIAECAAADDNLKKAEKLLAADPQNPQNPQNPQGLFFRALGNLYKVGKLEETFADLDKLVKMEPDGDTRLLVCEALWKLSSLESRRVDKKTAIEARNRHLERLVQIDPQNDSGHLLDASYTLGVSAMALKKADEMNRHFDRIKKLDPQDKSGYDDDIAFAKAMAPFYKREFKTAAEALRKFIAGYAGSTLLPKAYVQLSVCWYRAKEKDKAIETLEKLLKEFPEAKEIESARKWLKRLKK